MPSQTKEHYLKALYYLNQKGEEISISDLGKQLELSKPTVNDMVKKLKADGWVQYEKYKPLKLTDKGKQMASLIIRKHRLSEMFLTQVMGFGWEEVHEMAEEIEHIKSIKFFDRMDEILGFPKKDPHGSPIPDKNGDFVKPEYLILSQVKAGKTYVLKALRDSSKDLIEFLNKKELKLGILIKVVSIESFDRSVTIHYNNKMDIVLSNDVACRLMVEELE